jgi:hypothetical protein
MRTRVDPQLRREAETFSFRFACEDCAHFERTEGTCSLSFDASPRRAALDAAHLELCKAFELA